MTIQYDRVSLVRETPHSSAGGAGKLSSAFPQAAGEGSDDSTRQLFEQLLDRGGPLEHPLFPPEPEIHHLRCIQYNPDLYQVVERIDGKVYLSRFAVRLWNYSVALERRHQRVGMFVQGLAEKLLPPPPL